MSGLRQQPLEVAPDTFLVRANQLSLGGSVSTSMNSLCPWIALVDGPKYHVEVAKLAALDAAVITTAHGPTITSPSLDRAFELLAGLPTAVTQPLSRASGEQIARPTER